MKEETIQIKQGEENAMEMRDVEMKRASWEPGGEEANEEI